jgi:hypothetical protein
LHAVSIQSVARPRTAVVGDTHSNVARLFDLEPVIWSGRVTRSEVSRSRGLKSFIHRSYK